MKLLRYTHFNLSFLLFLLLGGWGTFFYYTVIDEVMDEGSFQLCHDFSGTANLLQS